MAKNHYFMAFGKGCCVFLCPSGLHLNDVIHGVAATRCIRYGEASEGDALALSLVALAQGLL